MYFVHHSFKINILGDAVMTLAFKIWNLYVTCFWCFGFYQVLIYMKNLIHSLDYVSDFGNVWEIKTFLTSCFIHAFTTSFCYCPISALIGMDTPFAILVNYKCSITEFIIFLYLLYSNSNSEFCHIWTLDVPEQICSVCNYLTLRWML